MSQALPSESQWFYEDNGQRKGPVSESKIIELIGTSIVYRGVSVWKQGYPDWIKVEDSELYKYFDKSIPPPMSGSSINNTVVWVLAFAPLIGLILEFFVGLVVHDGNEYVASFAVQNGHYWYISLALNIALSVLDEKRLKKAGHNTNKFKGWVWLVPVYLYQRAKATQQNLSYFIVWIVCFILVDPVNNSVYLPLH